MTTRFTLHLGDSYDILEILDSVFCLFVCFLFVCLFFVCLFVFCFVCGGVFVSVLLFDLFCNSQMYRL